VWSYGENALLGLLWGGHRECGNQARDKTVKVLWSNVDMRRVVLRADSTPAVWLSGTLANVLKDRDSHGEANRQEDSNRRSSKDLFQAHSISPKSPITSRY